MASATLSLNSAGYDLLEYLDAPGTNQLSVKKVGNAHQIKSTVKGNTIDAFGISTDQSLINSNVNVFASVSDFKADLDNGADTLNIFGNVSGSEIQLDNSSQLQGNFNDILNIQGNLNSVDGGLSSVDNTIYAGGGNDTIRIAGSIENSNIFLGTGNDSITIGGNATNVDIKGDEYESFNGNDYIEFRGAATDVRVQSGGGSDTVIFSNGLSSSVPDLTSDSINVLSGLAAVELGSGNDSLKLGKGTYENATFNTGSGTDTISIASGSFTNVNFQLDGAWDTSYNGSQEENLLAIQFHSIADGGDKLTSAANTWFTSTNFSSNNAAGDTLVFGSGSIFTDTNFYLGQGNDSLVFGSGSTFTNWNDIGSTINTGLGSDTIVFGSGASFFDNTILDLGNDGVEDIVRFAHHDYLPEFRITGADENDVLFLGTDSYRYDTSFDGWLINGIDTIPY